MLAEKDPYIESAYQKLQIISQDQNKRMEYEAREKAIRDYNQFLKEADARGEQRGIQIGEQRGIARICKLQDLLIQSGRYDDLARSATDDKYRENLLSEYGI